MPSCRIGVPQSLRFSSKSDSHRLFRLRAIPLHLTTKIGIHVTECLRSERIRLCNVLGFRRHTELQCASVTEAPNACEALEDAEFSTASYCDLRTPVYGSDVMDQPTGSVEDQFSPLAMALNALERSRANERLLSSYKCPCIQCKGGGRPMQRRTIESHLRRDGRDPALTHPMLVSFSITFAHFFLSH